ncbi:MAG: ribose transport system permease protein [Solirubrobacterales bacterium]|jgi:ribose transport system permease protein|nr:ribose transport system permease protein [Solirubrobacterales bacterium]
MSVSSTSEKNLESGNEAPRDPVRPKNGFAIARTGLARYGLVLFLIVEIVAFSILAPDTFPTTSNLKNILSSQAIFMILTLGLTVPILTGEFDVSIASCLGFVMVLAGYLMVLHHWAFVPALLVCIAAGVVIGLINAFLVVGVGINSFIATIGTATVLEGLTSLLSNQSPIPGLPEPLVTASTTELFGLPLPVFYGLGLATLLWLLYEHTPTGRRLMFVGAGREAGRLAGVRVKRLAMGAFIASGTIAGLAGLVYAGQIGTSDPTIGQSFLLPAFAGAFLGATAIKPGRPNAWGTVIALYVLTVGVTGLQLVGAGSWVLNVFNGMALIFGVAITRLAGKSEARAIAQ